jgi:hypothetical protein
VQPEQVLSEPHGVSQVVVAVVLGMVVACGAWLAAPTVVQVYVPGAVHVLAQTTPSLIRKVIGVHALPGRHSQPWWATGTAAQ